MGGVAVPPKGVNVIVGNKIRVAVGIGNSVSLLTISNVGVWMGSRVCDALNFGVSLGMDVCVGCLGMEVAERSGQVGDTLGDGVLLGDGEDVGVPEAATVIEADPSEGRMLITTTASNDVSRIAKERRVFTLRPVARPFCVPARVAGWPRTG